MNPKFVEWEQRDRLLSSWLVGSMIEDILNQLLDYNSANEIWMALASTYASRNTAKMMQYQTQLQNLKKGGLHMKDYLAQVKHLVSCLTAVGHKISDQDHVIYLLSGLGSEYESIVSVISSKTKPKPLQEVYSLLLSSEVRIEKNNSTSSSTLPSINLTTLQSSNNNELHPSPSHSQPRSNYSNNWGNKNRGNRLSRGRGWNNSNNNRLQCQLCMKFGHTVNRCFFRFDKSFHSANNSNSRFNNSATFNGSANLTTHGPNSSDFSTYSHSSGETNWYPDTGATNHVTYDSSNLSQVSDYNGGQHIKIGNGSGSGQWSNSSPRQLQ